MDTMGAMRTACSLCGSGHWPDACLLDDARVGEGERERDEQRRARDGGTVSLATNGKPDASLDTTWLHPIAPGARDGRPPAGHRA